MIKVKQYFRFNNCHKVISKSKPWTIVLLSYANTMANFQRKNETEISNIFIRSALSWKKLEWKVFPSYNSYFETLFSPV